MQADLARDRTLVMPPLPDIFLLSSKITVADICLWCGLGFRVLELLFTAALGVIKLCYDY